MQTSFFHRNGEQLEEEDEGEDHDSLDPDSHDDVDDDDDTYRKLQQLLAVDTSAACIPDYSGRVPFWIALASGMVFRPVGIACKIEYADRAEQHHERTHNDDNDNDLYEHKNWSQLVIAARSGDWIVPLFISCRRSIKPHDKVAESSE